MFLLEIYLEQYHRFSFTKIYCLKQSLFTDTFVLHKLPSTCKKKKKKKKKKIPKGMAVYSSTPVF